MEGFEKLRRFALGEVANHMGPNVAEDVMRVIDETEREMDERYVRLPVDAYGVLIRVGDELEPVGECGMRVTVHSIQLTNDGCWVFAGATCRRPHKYRHAKPDSWERIIEDAVNVHGNGFNPCWTDELDALVARCKALAGDAE